MILSNVQIAATPMVPAPMNRTFSRKTVFTNASTSVVGTPADVADVMENWVATDACDGFNVLPPYFNGGLADFVDMVVPELQRRGLTRKAYAHKLFRDNLLEF